MNDVTEAIKKHNNFVVLTHLNPDGDAVGSSRALTLALRKLGKQAQSVFLKEIPAKYSMLQTDFEYIIYKNTQDFTNCDCVICVDCADKRRLGEALELLNNKYTVNIDHHITNYKYGSVNYIKDLASNGEIVFDVIKALGVPFDKKMAANLYVAIATDTGNFKYEKVSGETFRKAGELVDTGFELTEVSDKIFNSKNYEGTLLISRIIDNIRLYFDGKLAITQISLDEMNKIGVKPEDCETAINYARDIESVELAVFIREMEDKRYKVSFRSKRYVDVAQIAVRFDGGGHKRAAGCTMCGDINDIKDTVIGITKELF